MNFLSLMVQIIAGWGGGAIAGCAFRPIDLGITRNSVLGIIGGAFGGQILDRLFSANDSATDLQIFFWSVVGGALGGSLLVVAVGSIRYLFSHKSR